jgi:chaperonin GroES
MARNIKPLGDRVLIAPLSDEEREKRTKSGIVIPDTAHKERPNEGRVVAVGDGRLTDKGSVLKPRVKRGQTVLFSQYSPSEIKVDGKEYLIVKEEDILAVIE